MAVWLRKHGVVLLLAFTWLLSLWLALWQYRLPDGYWPAWGVNPQGVAHFASVFGVRAAPLGAEVFAQGFRALIAGAVAAYALMLFFAYRRAFALSRPLLWAAWLFAMLVATVVPAGFSCDVYAYVGYARMVLLHGLNPYIHAQFELRALGDPIAPYLQWDMPSPYGPFWTELSVLLVWPFQSVSLVWQVLVMKWLAATALVWLALEASRLAERMQAGKGGLTFLAIVACPFLLLEGPASGHNDLLMLALLLCGMRLWHERRFMRAAWCVGLSAAIKFIPLLTVPWLLWMRWRDTRRTDAMQVVVIGACMLLPLVVTFLPFAGDIMPIGGLQAHVQHLQKIHRGDMTSRWVPLIAYLVLSIWVVKTSPDHWSTAWVAMALTLLVFVGPAFPWYFAWPVAVALTRWDKVGMGISGLCLLAGHWLLLGYVWPHPPGAGVIR